ncbi:MAG: helix-turn-helix domain-containing protein [Oscillospiraceae bacterium]|jgi:predicted transcriptional regulator|nr:helix-turn-helix domain-containing protein [Oscillospiraceae bacterium]
MPDHNAFPQTKHLNLTIAQWDEMQPIMRALGSPLRLQILHLLGAKPMHVGEIAQALDVPVSTAALNIRELEEGGLLLTENQPGTRGIMKLCSRRLDSLTINLVPPEKKSAQIVTMSLPIGSYSFAEGIEPTCGLSGVDGDIAEQDNPRSFYSPDRYRTQILWFRQGYLTYHYALLRIEEIDVQWIEFSCELCSEAPMFRDPWKSDIDVTINDVPIGVYTSPADFGGRRGLLNPDWWSDLNTQFGLLTTWKITREGSLLNGLPVSSAAIADLRLAKLPYIAVKIGVAAQAENVGGMTLFGKEFGDFPQNLVMRIGYISRR